MKIAIIGTGRMGKGLLKTFYKSYPGNILFAGRSKEVTQNVIDDLKLNLKAETIEEALKANIIIPTMWFRDLVPWAYENEMILKGKIIIDITNPFNEDFSDFTLSPYTSSAEELQKILHGSEVVAAFKNTFWVVFDNPLLQNLKSDVFVAAQKDSIRSLIIELLKPLPFRILDAGTLKNCRTIERMTLLSSELARKAGSHPRIAFNLWGLEHECLSL